jgi:GWxTD domain-containing protein
MRINIPWTGAVLLFANLVSAQISFHSHRFTATTTRFQFESPANSLATSAPQPNVIVASAPPTDDDAKRNWSRANAAISEKPFLIDFASFIAKPNLTFVEFYIQIGYDHLSFARDGKFFQAGYDIDFYIEDLDGNLLQTQSARDEVRVTQYDDTTAPNNYRIILLSSSLQPRRYRLRAIITDKESGKNYEMIDKFSVRDFSNSNLTLSDLQFSRNIQVDSAANAFVKHNRHIEPNVPHAYGQYVGQLFLYYEIYNLAAPNSIRNSAADDSAVIATAAADSFQTFYTIHNEMGEEVKQLEKSTRKPGNSCVQSVIIPIANLKSGFYTLTVRVFDKANGSYAESSGRFNIQWDIFSFKDKKFEEILEQMRCLAGKDELARLAQLPETDRQRGLLDFWQRRDPTPSTPRNEAMEEYYRRINFANARFKWAGGEGWKSPQGQVYLTYGAPDNVQRYTNSSFGRVNDGWMESSLSSEARQEFSSRLASGQSRMFNKPYEIWEYTQLNRSFVFVDFRGFGMFELVDPPSLNSIGWR